MSLYTEKNDYKNKVCRAEDSEIYIDTFAPQLQARHTVMHIRIRRTMATGYRFFLGRSAFCCKSARNYKVVHIPLCVLSYEANRVSPFSVWPVWIALPLWSSSLECYARLSLLDLYVFSHPSDFLNL